MSKMVVVLFIVQLADAGNIYIPNERTSFLFHESYNAFTYNACICAPPLYDAKKAL